MIRELIDFLTSIFNKSTTMLLHPRRAGKHFAGSSDLRPAAWLVVGFGIFYSVMFYISHLAHDYPPAPEVLQVWVETWGEFAMLPFLKIPI